MDGDSFTSNLLSKLDAFYFFFLPNCSGYNFQYHVKQKW